MGVGPLSNIPGPGPRFGPISHTQKLYLFVVGVCILAAFFGVLLARVGDRAEITRSAGGKGGSAAEGMLLPSPPQDVREGWEGAEKEFSGKFGSLSLYALLTRHEVTPDQIHKLVVAAAPFFNLGRVKEGQRYLFRIDPKGRLSYFYYEIDGSQALEAVLRDDAFSASLVPISYESHLEALSLTIRDSVYQTLVREGENPQLALDLANIFAWQVDFANDFRPGDRVRLLAEKRTREEGDPSYGPIHAAALSVGGSEHQAFHFRFPDGEADYFGPDGRSLRMQFLKSPLHYRTISSGYTNRRFHPILKSYRPHYAIDYAAPRGTPVMAVADGTVAWAGRKGGNGHFIRLRHRNGYESLYAHLSRYAKGLRKGMRVGQGQVIGYVGSTGLSTGPHLDFRMKKDGSYINPLKMQQPSIRSLDGGDLEAFEQVRNRLWSKLEALTARQLGEELP